MRYSPSDCLDDDYFKCSDTDVLKDESETEVEKLSSEELPLSTDLYSQAVKPDSKSDREKIFSQGLPLSTENYRKSSVKKVTYRLVKK